MASATRTRGKATATTMRVAGSMGRDATEGQPSRGTARTSKVTSLLSLDVPASWVNMAPPPAEPTGGVVGGGQAHLGARAVERGGDLGELGRQVAGGDVDLPVDDLGTTRPPSCPGRSTWTASTADRRAATIASWAEQTRVRAAPGTGDRVNDRPHRHPDLRGGRACKAQREEHRHLCSVPERPVAVCGTCHMQLLPNKDCRSCW